jgi:hypothetical protein
LNGTRQAVFVSYAAQDAEVAGRICEALSAAGIEVWFDKSELRGAGVSKPAADDGDVNAGCDESDGCGMSKRVRRDVFACQSRRSLRRGRHILRELKPHARCPERLTVPVHKETLIIRTRLSVQQRL